MLLLFQETYTAIHERKIGEKKKRLLEHLPSMNSGKKIDKKTGIVQFVLKQRKSTTYQKITKIVETLNDYMHGTSLIWLILWEDFHYMVTYNHSKKFNVIVLWLFKLYWKRWTFCFNIPQQLLILNQKMLSVNFSNVIK